MTTITADYFRRAALPSRSVSASDDPYAQVTKRIAGDAASSLQARAFADLGRIARECAKDGWDGYRAKPVTHSACDRAFSFLIGLPTWMSPPDIVPEADGEIAIEWYVAPDQTFSISIGESGPLHYAGLFGHNEEVHGVVPFNCSVPENILQYISDVLGSPAGRRAA
jgi:hypothetical protein